MDFIVNSEVNQPIEFTNHPTIACISGREGDRTLGFRAGVRGVLKTLPGRVTTIKTLCNFRLRYSPEILCNGHKNLQIMEIVDIFQ